MKLKDSYVGGDGVVLKSKKSGFIMVQSLSWLSEFLKWRFCMIDKSFVRSKN